MGETPTHKVLAQMIRDVSNPVNEKVLKPIGRTLDKALCGYIGEQALTTFNVLGPNIVERISNIHDPFENDTVAPPDSHPLKVGFMLGAVQDFAGSWLAIGYLTGNAGPNEQAAVSAGALYVGGKLVLNAASFAGYRIHKWYQSARTRVQETA